MRSTTSTRCAAVSTLIAILGAAIPVAGPAQPDLQGWHRVWSDEFDRDGAPDPRNWTFESGFVRNEERQWYRAGNARCSNGLLVIEARRETVENPRYVATSPDWTANRPRAEYTSASLMTKGRHAWRYGRFEMRARIDTRLGMWPAFWTLGVDGEWPEGGEIDIMEFYRGLLLANVAWGGRERWVPTWDSERRPITSFGDERWASRFHDWRMDWDEDRIELSVDGIRLNSTDLSDTINPRDGKNPFRRPQYLLLSLAIGGTNGGDSAGTSFPARFEIDYVRVYSRVSANEKGSSAPVP
jgi:beta-glucanase (GH16 family)